MFESFMRRDIGFFDDENNAVGTLTTQLADDARAVHRATGQLASILLLIIIFICK